MGIHILNCLNKFADLWKGKEDYWWLPFYFLFSLIWCATKIIQPFPQGFFLNATVSTKRINMLTILCASVCIMVGDSSSMPQNYINCQNLHRFSCVLTAFSIHLSRGNKISQTAQTLGSHIYSTNVDIHRLWHDIPRFLMHFLDKYIYCSRNTEIARFVYILGSSNAKPEDSQIVFLIQPLVEHQIVW